MKSSADEKGSSAIIASQIDDELGGSAVQVSTSHKKLKNLYTKKLYLLLLKTFSAFSQVFVLKNAFSELFFRIISIQLFPIIYSLYYFHFSFFLGPCCSK